jgi:hypothetical protein
VAEKETFRRDPVHIPTTCHPSTGLYEQEQGSHCDSVAGRYHARPGARKVAEKETFRWEIRLADVQHLQPATFVHSPQPTVIDGSVQLDG